MEKVKKSDIIKATVTGVQKYGAFVNTEDYEGLIHISEISYGYVKNVNDYLKVGDNIFLRIILQIVNLRFAIKLGLKAVGPELDAR